MEPDLQQPDVDGEGKEVTAECEAHYFRDYIVGPYVRKCVKCGYKERMPEDDIPF